MSPFTAKYEYEELTINDDSPDATKWSFNKMKEVFDYREIIAKIVWCARNTRPDLSVVSSVLRRHTVQHTAFSIPGNDQNATLYGEHDRPRHNA